MAVVGATGSLKDGGLQFVISALYSCLASLLGPLYEKRLGWLRIVIESSSGPVEQLVENVGRHQVLRKLDAMEDEFLEGVIVLASMKES